MGTIVVATDFSTVAAHAASYAASMALVVQAELYLMHAYELPASYGDISLPVDIGRWQEDAEAALLKLRVQLEQETKGKLSIRGQVYMGSYFSTLERVCEEKKPYAVVIGCTGKTAAGRILFGSNAVHTLKHLEWPVLTVPADTTFSGIQQVGLACDLELVRETVPFQEIATLLKDFKAGLHILNVGSKTIYDPEVKAASQLLQEKLKPQSLKFHFLSTDDVDQGILDFAEKIHVDLLIVLPKRKSLINALLHKSHTRQFVLHSHVPLMALHAPRIRTGL
ncbi:universal stress protein [Paraflavitalea soli]|uniref:Universal stress protein n=1 Tax=Paraflavitalea soli TaxID=2315862 RepID=A0A3B7MKK8_9BACT|nr:universal stress protein [Paraflavitalea soli]AXY74187.1 universal stress protein [Paraflavitalea soli]